MSLEELFSGWYHCCITLLVHKLSSCKCQNDLGWGSLGSREMCSVETSFLLWKT